MKKKTKDIEAILILLILLIIPTIYCWPLVLSVTLLLLIYRRVIYKIKRTFGVLEKTKANTQNEEKNIIKGQNAEDKIIKILENVFVKENIIQDSYFRDDEIVTTQVDILAIDTTGIYVIESKAFSGVIKGNQYDKNWVQLFANKKHYTFSNPIIQNKRHIEDIKRNLETFDVPDIAYKSYVVFDNNCKLDLNVKNNDQLKVVKQEELLGIILKDKKQSLVVIPNNKVEEIARRIKGHANVDDEFKEMHNERRKNNVIYK
ncbi:MAG: NERD domain-containing protein [Clostridia bacterium]|nr:NERD domain-containing protein [Clostridia bacterium]